MNNPRKTMIMFIMILAAILAVSMVNAVTNVTVVCPQYSPLPPGWCSNGIIVSGGYSSNGCVLPPKCLSCDLHETLTEGESHNYTVSGKTYSIQVLSVDSKAYFVVNGENVRSLDAQDSGYKLVDGSGIKVISIIPNEAGDVTEDEVTFCFGANPSTCTFTGSTCCKGDVCSGVSLNCIATSRPIISGCNDQCMPIAECEPYSTCVANGESVYTNPYVGPTSCCNKIAGIKPNVILSGDNCIAPNNSVKGTCVNNWYATCGDGKCNTNTEDKCNCPKDCTSTPPNGLYVKLNEKFSLVQGQSAKVTDYNDLKLTLSDLSTVCASCASNSATSSTGGPVASCIGGPCSTYASLVVENPVRCIKAPCPAVTEKVSLSEGETKQVAGADITFLAKQGTAAVLIVKANAINEQNVGVSISPVEDTITYGEKAVYKVTVVDKHPQIACAVCVKGNYCPPCSTSFTYLIDVRNLPFSKAFPKQITLNAGESQTFELSVQPYQMETVEKEETLQTTGTKSATSAASAGSASSVASVQSPVLTKVANTQSVSPTVSGSSSTNVASESVPEPTSAQVPIKVPSSLNKYRTYDFNVRVTEKGNPDNQNTAYAVLNIKPEITPPVQPPDFPGEQTKIQLYKGWNLITLPGKLIKFEKISLGKKLIGFVYLKEEQRYVTLQEAEKILGNDFAEYLNKNAFWVYSYQDVTLKATVDTQVSYNDLSLVKGWNLVPITEDMLGGYLSDIKGDCVFEKLALWNPSTQSWDKISETYAFSSTLQNKGFLIKASDKCTLGGMQITAPPAMPD